MERKAVIEFLATLPPADLLNMVAEVARLRDCRAAEAATSSGSGGSADCTRERTAANARRGRSSSTAERRAKRQAESRVALATAVARRSVVRTTLFAECQLRCGEWCSAIRVRATDGAAADLFKAASDAILDDLGRRNLGWADKVKGTAHQIFLLADGEAKSTAVFSHRAGGNDIVVHLMATATACQRKGYGSMLLHMLQAHANERRIYVEISGTEVPNWWRKKHFRLIEDVSVNPKLWQQSKVIYWSRELERQPAVLHKCKDGSVSSRAAMPNAGTDAPVISLANCKRQAVSGASNASFAESASSCKSQDYGVLEDQNPLLSPATPAVTSIGTAAAAYVRSSRRSILRVSNTASSKQSRAQPRENRADPRETQARGGRGRNCSEESSKSEGGGGNSSKSGKRSSSSTLQPARDESSESPEFFDSWADPEMLVGRKTREHLGIHVAKENETPRIIAKLHNIDPELLLQLNEDWYPQLQLSHRLKKATKLIYSTTGTDHVIEGTVLGQVDPDGVASPFWRVQYPEPPSANAVIEARQHRESFVLEKSLEEVWAGCWAWEAFHDGWILSGNRYINEMVAKSVDIETHKEVEVEEAEQNGAEIDHGQANCYSNGSASATRRQRWKWVMGQVVGFGGEDADNLDEHGDQVWRVHYEDYDYEDLNERQLAKGMRNAKTVQKQQLGAASTAHTEVSGHRHKKPRYLQYDAVETFQAEVDGHGEAFLNEPEELLEDDWFAQEVI